MRAYVRDQEYRRYGLPPAQRREARDMVMAIGRNLNVMPLILRRIDDARWTHCGLRLAHFEGRRCVWVALPGICMIFEQEDVARTIHRRLRRRAYTWEC